MIRAMRFNGRGKIEDGLSCLFGATPAFIMFTIIHGSAILNRTAWYVSTDGHERRRAGVHQATAGLCCIAVQRETIGNRECGWRLDSTKVNAEPY